MSLILDALRKMEQERKTRRGAAKDLRPEVLRYRGAAQSQPRSKPYLLVAVGGLLLMGGVGAGFLLKGNSGKSPNLSAEQPPVAVTVTAAAASPGAPIPRFEPAAPPAPVAPEAPAPVTSAAPKAPVPAVVQAPVAAADVTDEAEAAVPVPNPPRSTRARKRQETKAALKAAASGKATRTAAVSAQAPGDIALSGIAWQDERQMRRAVLNGSLVGEGAMVAGARVVEIKENRVRLSRGGQQFELALSAALSSR